MRTKLTKLFIDFFESEKTSGIILILCTLTSIAVANSCFGTDYLELWHTKIAIGISQLPEDVQWKHIIGAGFLGGIGFTMSIFITLLAFDNPEIVQSSKISILISSFLAGTVGFLILNRQPVILPNHSD